MGISSPDFEWCLANQSLVSGWIQFKGTTGPGFERWREIPDKDNNNLKTNIMHNM